MQQRLEHRHVPICPKQQANSIQQNEPRKFERNEV